VRINWKRIKLTKKEKEIERSLLRGEYVPASPEHFRDIARSIERRRKQAVISLRINQQDLDGLKQKAKELGVPYQTFITEILHRYAA
jgi:predicted DNA binding CopG/RHH family protein